VSPCIAFNNHAGSTKSYEYVRQHNEAVNRLDFIEDHQEITADYAPGETVTVHQHDGSALRLKKIANDYDATDRIKVMNYLQEHAARGEVITGLLYIDPDSEDLHEHINTVDTPLNQLGAKDLCPGMAALEKINASMR
jgi:2-oxoglutarate ferredoxin oxidoreductase subunit beta